VDSSTRIILIIVQLLCTFHGLAFLVCSDSRLASAFEIMNPF